MIPNIEMILTLENLSKKGMIPDYFQKKLTCGLRILLPGTNIHVWFATTGKKNKGIKKIGKGHYQLKK